MHQALNACSKRVSSAAPQVTGGTLPKHVSRNMFIYDFPPWAAAAGLDLETLLTLPMTGIAARQPPQMPPQQPQPPPQQHPPLPRMSSVRSRSPPPQPPTRVPAWGAGPFVKGASVLYKQTVRREGRPDSEEWRPARIHAVRRAAVRLPFW